MMVQAAAIEANNCINRIGRMQNARKHRLLIILQKIVILTFSVGRKSLRTSCEAVAVEKAGVSNSLLLKFKLFFEENHEQNKNKATYSFIWQ